MEIHWSQRRKGVLSLLAVLVLIGLVTALAPVERTLGERARLVYFHGAWVWAGKIAFAAAAAAGLIGLLFPAAPAARRIWQRGSQALGWTGMVFWLTYLPLSLLVQQMNWGGIFWDEPRWRVPLMFGIVGLLLQVGLYLLEDIRFTAAANTIFGAALWWALGRIENVLHPDSPIFHSGALRIQLFFIALLALSLLFGMLLSWLLYPFAASHK